MSFDGFVTHGIVNELNNKILNGKIDKVYQPQSDELIFVVRTFGETFRLLLSASASNARIHLTEHKFENPSEPPMMCMLMRKHLCGGTIVKISQIDFDRIVKIDVNTKNELGDECIKSVIIEIMGRYSNIIFIDENNKILDSVKHIDFTTSSVRCILPGFIYEYPPKQSKINILSASMPVIMNNLSDCPDDTPIDKFLVSEIMGMSPILARQIVFDFYNDTNVLPQKSTIAPFVVHLFEWFEKVKSNQLVPCVVFDEKENPVYFSCTDLSQYSTYFTVKRYTSLSESVDAYYLLRRIKESISRRSAYLDKLIRNNIERCEKKTAIHEDNLIKCKDKEKYKQYGDLITANIYKIKAGDSVLKTENFYSGKGEEIEIPLDTNKSPAMNARSYYKKYSKLKTREIYSQEQIEISRQEKFYLESIAESLKDITSSEELWEIREELSNEGYIKKTSEKKKNKKKLEPRSFVSDDGYTILVGRNNKQNDVLTLKTAFSTDIWLHTKQIPGSHTLIRTNGTGVAPDATILQAAKICAYFSKARNSSKVPVDYTLIKNVKKPSGVKPGMVVYDHYNTVYVDPEMIKEEV